MQLSDFSPFCVAPALTWSFGMSAKRRLPAALPCVQRKHLTMPALQLPPDIVDYRETPGIARYGHKAKAAYAVAFVFGPVCGVLLTILFFWARRPGIVEAAIVLGVLSCGLLALGWRLSCYCGRCEGPLEKVWHRETVSQEVQRGGPLLVCHSCRRFENRTVLEE